MIRQRMRSEILYLLLFILMLYNTYDDFARLHDVLLNVLVVLADVLIVTILVIDFTFSPRRYYRKVKPDGTISPPLTGLRTGDSVTLNVDDYLASRYKETGPEE